MSRRTAEDCLRLGLKASHIRDANAVEILGFLHRVNISLFVAWAEQQPNLRDRTHPTWQAHHVANRWRMIHQVAKAPN